MNIAHVNFSFLIGGTENLLIDILNHQSLEHNVSVVIVNKKYNGEMLRRISDRVSIILINRQVGSRLELGKIVNLWRVILKKKPDIIHCHTPKLIRILFPFKNICLYTHHNTQVSLTDVG